MNTFPQRNRNYFNQSGYRFGTVLQGDLMTVRNLLDRILGWKVKRRIKERLDEKRLRLLTQMSYFTHDLNKWIHDVVKCKCTSFYLTRLVPQRPEISSSRETLPREAKTHGFRWQQHMKKINALQIKVMLKCFWGHCDKNRNVIE